MGPGGLKSHFLVKVTQRGRDPATETEEKTVTVVVGLGQNQLLTDLAPRVCSVWGC